MDTSIRDINWDDVRIYAVEKGIERKAGGLRALHVQMYDVAKTERECIAIKEQGLAEVDRLVGLPKEPTMEEQVATMQKEIKELKKVRTLDNQV